MLLQITKQKIFLIILLKEIKWKLFKIKLLIIERNSQKNFGKNQLIFNTKMLNFKQELKISNNKIKNGKNKQKTKRKKQIRKKTKGLGKKYKDKNLNLTYKKRMRRTIDLVKVPFQKMENPSNLFQMFQIRNLI